jgi:uncharacterized membrane protein
MVNEVKVNNADSKKNIDGKLVAYASSVCFSGPLPPPEILEHYEKICPGAADRIITMSESQSEHRKGLEKSVITSDISRANKGLIFGFIVGLVGLLGSVFLIGIGKGAYGVAIGAIDLVALVSVFVYGSQSRKKEREQRREPKEAEEK